MYKLCRKCKHCKTLNIGYTAYGCHHPTLPKDIDVVTGGEAGWRWCVDMRQGPCGMDGKLWEPKSLWQKLIG